MISVLGNLIFLLLVFFFVAVVATVLLGMSVAIPFGMASIGKSDISFICKR